LKRLQSVIII